MLKRGEAKNEYNIDMMYFLNARRTQALSSCATFRKHAHTYTHIHRQERKYVHIQR